MKRGFWGLVIAFLFGLSFVVIAGAANAGEEDKINIRLFGKSALDGYKGCSFALWQRNRDPQKDKSAYVFYVRFHDAHPMPALVKINKNVLELEKIEIGIKDSGLSDKFQLYRDEKKTTSVLVEIQEEKRTGDSTDVSRARLTFIQKNKYPFVMIVKGGFRCPARDSGAASNDNATPESIESKSKKRVYLPPNLDANAVRLGRKVAFNKLSQVPRHVLKVVRDNGSACNLDNVPGAGERYSISDAMTLWVVPCDLFAASSSVMLVTALNGTKHAIGMEIPKRPGQSGSVAAYDMLRPVIHPKSGVVTVSAMGRQGDCGTVEHFQLIFAEGQSVELKLLEVREKNDCNGVKVGRENLPLVYRAR